MGLSRDCIFKNTIMCFEYLSDYLNEVFFKIKFDLRFAGETHVKVHN